MHFKVTARTILQLGAELISSDAIAFYELIKNAFDAKSKKVTVRVVIRLPQQIIEQYFEQYEQQNDRRKISKEEFSFLKESLSNQVNIEAPLAEDLKTQFSKAESLARLALVVKDANFITIEDQGEGMSLDDLEDIYLTIGTRNRKKQRDQTSGTTRPILGEKGLGRLSVMRLGDGLRVETTKEGEEYYNILEIDWTIFSHDSDALLESVNLEPQVGSKKPNPSIKGTTIRIYDLRSTWNREKLEEISRSQLSRFIDPFEKKNRDFIQLWFNKEPVVLENLDKLLFEYAHAAAKASLDFVNGQPVFHGEVVYRTYDRRNTFSLAGTHLASVLETANYREALTNLGSFQVQIYWFNRQLLRKSAGVPDAEYIKQLVETWGGGLMVYRDGFRVNPYGGPNDDWLALDPKALKSGGYKMNRKQIVGKVDISSVNNPKLLDQTNREGLRDNTEKKLLVTLLQYFIQDEIRTFLDEIKKSEDENLAALSLNEIERRINEGQNRVRFAIEQLKTNYPQIKKENETFLMIEDVLEESTILFKRAKASADVLNDRLKTTIDLAGLGLMVDVIAHELNRSTDYALKTINTLSSSQLPQGIKEQMDTLGLQLKTLKTRLKVIDPLGPSGRQQKMVTDLRKIVVDTFKAHELQFKRQNIQLRIVDKNPTQEWKIKVVPGMIVQILENLIANSVYWIKQEQNLNKLKIGIIEVVLDRKREVILFSDNGPGIPKLKKEDIFRPFFSTKPPGAGKGLGLYISREIAKYHGGSLSLLDSDSPTINTFILSLK